MSSVDEKVDDTRNPSEDTAINPKTRVNHTMKSLVYQGLQEKDVDITEFTSSVPGITGILKHRLSDFHVHEIALDGTVLHLTSRTVPEKEDEIFPLQDTVDESGLCEKYAEDIDKLVSLQNTKQIEIDVEGLTKEQRKSIHTFLKFKHGNKLTTNTKKDDQGKQSIVIRLSTLVKNDRQTWPKSRPEYLHFVLHKFNMDTTNVMSILSKQLRIKVNTIKYAGTKDKRGNTTQMISVRKLDANNVAKLHTRGFWTGNYVYKDSCLKLGDLKGNKFHIVLRNIKANEEDISNAIETLKVNGFINYYGLQRFGSSVVSPTYVIGKSLACGNCEEAIEHILKPRPSECLYETDTERARKIWWETRDPKLALQELSKKNFSTEAKIIRSLAANGPKSYVNAFQIIPKNLVLLYLHSYQSLMWNKIVSQRIRKYGLKPIVGDLVFKDNAPMELIFDEENVEEETDESNLKFPEVEIISEETLSKYTIFDVVYPLPGFNVRYPENEIEKWYIDLLAVDNLTSEKLLKKNKLFSLKGTYRNIVSKAEDITWSIIEHISLDQDLVSSDIEILENRIPECPVGEVCFRSLSVEFALRPSSYATMVVREITKEDTSSHSQLNLCKLAQLKPQKRSSPSPTADQDEDIPHKKIKITCEKESSELSTKD